MIKRIGLLLPLFFFTSAQADDSPITVYAARHTAHTAVNGPKTIISREKIRATGLSTLKQTLQSAGGLQINDSTGNGSQAAVSMRGFGANADSNALILINGIPLTNPDLAPPNLNVIPLNDISRIEITAGSESVLYGDQAVGGIINIVTNELDNEAGSIACHGGSFNQYGCNGSYSSTLQQLNYRLSLQADHTDNYREHNEYDQQHADMTFNYHHARGNLQTTINLLNENMQYPGALTDEQVRQNRRQASNDTDYFKDLNGSIQLLDKRIVNDKWTLETALARRQMSGQGVLYSAFTQSRVSNYIRPTLKGRLFEASLTSGVDLQDDRYDLSSLYGETKDNQQKYGGFAYASIPWRERTTFSVGARGAGQTSQLDSYTTNNNVNRAFASTVGLAYQLSPLTNVYLRRAESFRFPKADENAATTPGSTGLRTQRGVSYESGVEFTQNTTHYGLNIYQLNLKDEIAYDPFQTAQTPFGSNQNLAPTQRQGLSLSISQPVAARIILDAQYNLVSALFRQGIYADKHIPLVAGNLIHAGMQYTLNDSWQTYLEALYTGSQYAANDFANVTGQLGGYTTYGFNVRYTRKHLSASLRADNIFNKYYYFYSVYQTGMDTTFFYPAPTRNVMLVVEYEV